MKVVIAPDSFKSTISASEAATAISNGWRRARHGDDVIRRPMADGGEGTVHSIAEAVADAQRQQVDVTAQDGGRRVAEWLLIPDIRGGTAVVELANASGIETLNGALRPWSAHTLGLGQVIAAALRAGVSRLVVGVGSSCSTDGGVGMLTALGARFLDDSGNPIAWGAAGLVDIARADFTELAPLPARGVTVLADVSNPLLGAHGAAAVFGPQKGFETSEVPAVDESLRHLSVYLSADPQTSGAGAAGGTAFALLHWGASIRPGAEHVAQLQSLETTISNADLVITGEGSFDAQSLGGKAPHHIAELARRSGTPVAVIAGRISDDAPTSDLVSYVSLSVLSGSPEAAMSDPAAWLAEAGEAVARTMTEEVGTK